MNCSLSPHEAIAYARIALAAVVEAVEGGDTPLALAILRAIAGAGQNPTAAGEVLSAVQIVRAALMLGAAAESQQAFGEREGAAFDALIADQKRLVENIYAAAAAPMNWKN